MIIKLIKNIKVCFFILFLMTGMFFAGEVWATIDSVNVSFGAAGTPTGSLNGEGTLIGTGRYYIVNNAYNFDIEIQTSGSSDYSTVTDVRLIITTDGSEIEVTMNADTESVTGVVGGGSAVVSRSGTLNHFTLKVSYTVAASSNEKILGAGVITARATSTYDGITKSANDFNNEINHTYGIIATPINSVSITSVAAGTDLGGNNYYIIGGDGTGTYNFDVRIQTNLPVFTSLTDVRLIINSVIEVQVDASSGVGSTPDPVVTGGGTATGEVLTGGTAADFIVRIAYTVTSGTTEAVWQAGRAIDANARSTFAPLQIKSDATTRDYGIIATPINSVSITSVATGTNLGGNNYYIIGGGGTGTYNFDVRVQTNLPVFTSLTDVRLLINGVIDIRVDASGGVGATPVPVVFSGGGTATGEVLVGGTAADFTVSVVYTVTSGTTEAVWQTGRAIAANARSTFAPAQIVSDATTHDYGIIATPINSVSITSVATGTNLGGNNYYIIGGDGTGTYNFDVRIQTNLPVFTSLTDVRLIINSVIEVQVDASSGIGSTPNPVVTGGGTATGEVLVGGTAADFTVSVVYTVTSGTTEAVWQTGRAIAANARSTFAPAQIVSDATTHNYGIIATPINSVSITSVAAGTDLGGNLYYIIGGGGTGTYNFDVRVQTNLPVFTSLTDVRLLINGVIDIRVDASGGVGATPVPVVFSGGGTATGEVLVGGTAADFIVRIAYTVTSGTTEAIWQAGRAIDANARSTFAPLQIKSDATTYNYGIITTQVHIQPIPTGTNIAGGNYYAVGYDYTFNIDIETPESDFTNITNFTFTIPSTNNITFLLNPSALGGTGTYNTTANAANFSIISGDDNGYASAVISSMTGGNFSITLTYHPSGIASESSPGSKTFAASLIRTIHAGVAVPDFNPPDYNYGIVSTVQFINYALTTTASDGFVNPWDNIFNLTGNIVYNVASATIPNDAVPDTAITVNPFLVYDNDHAGVADVAVTDIVDANSDNAVSLTVQDPITPGNSWFPTLLDDGIGTYTFRIRTDIGGPLVTDITWTSANLGTLICDKFQVVDVRFQNGGGLDNPPDYHRNIYTAGTQMQVVVQMQYQGAVNTTQQVDVVASYNYGGLLRTTTLIIPAGGNTSNWVEIENPSATEVSPPDTLNFNGYQISSIIEQGGGRYSGGAGQNTTGRIIQDPTSPRIFWDNADPPGTDAGMFTSWMSTTSTVDAITLNWTALGADPVFSSYRIYYKPVLTAAWSMIDVNTDPPATDSLGQISTGTYTVTGLQSITEYQYYLTAIDIFGNETLAANRAHGGTIGDPSHTVTTGAYGLEVKITDGITAYNNAALIIDNLNHLTRPLLDSSIRFEIDIIGASQPSEMNVIIANTTADGFDSNPNDDVFDLHPDMDNEVSADWDIAAASNGFFRIPISKVSPNKWAGNISSENPLITPGQGCKFILEVIQGGTPTYYGYNPNLNMDTTSFTFSIIDPPKVTPWPTRILNNVITSKNPVAYPAYYLTDDAYVTIIAYDIKGRPVATLLDNAFRRSGQNIREQGWRGTNKAGRKLGVGLYYVHIKAKRVSDGKTIINKFEKVVMAR